MPKNQKSYFFDFRLILLDCITYFVAKSDGCFLKYYFFNAQGANSGVTAGGGVILLTGKFLMIYWEKRGKGKWVYQNGNFLMGKKKFNAGKNDFAPSEKYSSYAPGG